MENESTFVPYEIDLDEPAIRVLAKKNANKNREPLQVVYKRLIEEASDTPENVTLIKGLFPEFQEDEDE